MGTDLNRGFLLRKLTIQVNSHSTARLYIYSMRKNCDGGVTPAGIVLFMLVNDYLDEKIPRSRSLLFFIASHTQSIATFKSTAHLVTTLVDFHYSLKSYFLTKDPNGHNEQLDKITDWLHCSIAAINGPDDLYRWSRENVKKWTFSEHDTHEPCHLPSKRSPLGNFMRNISIMIRLLSFEEYDDLYSAFDNFIKNNLLPTIAEKKHCSHGSPDMLAERQTGIVAPLEIRRLTQVQSKVLQSIGITTPLTFESALEKFAFTTLSAIGSGTNHRPHSSSYLASFHYLRYLEYLNDGDYHASFDALHQYFDYVVSEGSMEFYHFALIAKASLHVVFGEEQDALRTIEEAGNIAREHKDEIALTFVLTWLYKALDKWASLRSSKKTFKQRDSKLLELLVVKDLEQQSFLNANVLQLEYENILLCGASQKKCFQAMSKSLYCWLNCNSNSLGKISRMASRHWLRSGYPTLAEVYLKVSEISTGRRASQINDKAALSACEIFFWKGEDEKVLDIISLFGDSSLSSRKFDEELSIWKIIYMIKLQLKTGEFVSAKELLSLIDASSSNSAMKAEVSRLNVQLMSSCGNKQEALRLLQSWTKSSSLGQESPSDLISSYLIKSDLLLQANLLGASFVLILEQMTRAAKHGLYCLNIELAVRLIHCFSACQDKMMLFEVSKALLPILHRSNNLNLILQIYLQIANLRINLPHATSELFKLALSSIEPNAEIPFNNARTLRNEKSGRMELLHQGKGATKSGIRGLRKTRIPQGSITSPTNL